MSKSTKEFLEEKFKKNTEIAQARLDAYKKMGINMTTVEELAQSITNTEYWLASLLGQLDVVAVLIDFLTNPDHKAVVRQDLKKELKLLANAIKKAGLAIDKGQYIGQGREVADTFSSFLYCGTKSEYDYIQLLAFMNAYICGKIVIDDVKIDDNE